MTTPTIDTLERTRPRNADPAVGAHGRRLLTAPLAARVAAAAVIVGVTGDLLLHESLTGLAFPVWMTLAALCMIALVWNSGRAMPREAGAWLATALLFSCGLAWRSAETLQVFDLLSTVGALAMAAVALNNERAALLALRLRDTLWALGAVVLDVVVGPVPVALELAADGRRERSLRPARPAIRRALIVAAVVLVFGSLLRSADPIFASLVSLPDFDVDNLVGHVVLTVFFAWVFGGWARSSLAIDPDPRRAPNGMPFSLDMADVTTTLTTLNVLFGAFVATQLGWFFGGERFLQARTGLTVASYARQGFFQMVVVVALVVPLLVATRAALRPGRELARRHTRLSLPVIGLLGAIIVSAVLRMKLYVRYYGMTTERFYPLVVMVWLGIVLVWLALTVLRGWGRPFLAGALVSGLATLAALNVADPDMIVARINVDRAAHVSLAGEPALDVGFLASLSGRAVAVATRATLANSVGPDGSQIREIDDAQRCEAARELLARWGPTSPARLRRSGDAAWRSWNAGEAVALDAVAPHSAELRTVKHAACARARQRPPQR
ncbi:MAG TPA: DUF4173 domain-containing protein [Gemmatimonadaceae bacterium]|nr:DUF4173 domain-containing protein [Gemmatimonadaceae bacterium]